jgi:hypothetical protein
MARDLNVSYLMFFRYGSDGGGKCLLSAFCNATGMQHCHKQPAARRAAYDNERARYLANWRQQDADESTRRRQALVQKIFDIANSGPDHKEESTVAIPNKNSAEHRKAVREEAWKHLGDDLSKPNQPLGWDALAWMSHIKQINVLLYVNYTETKDLGAGTKAAQSKWAEAIAAGGKRLREVLREQGRMAPGGRWHEHTTSTTPRVITTPIVEGWPFIVLYQRTSIMWKVRVVSGEEKTETDGGGGHYEAVVVKDVAKKGHYLGKFRADAIETGPHYQHVMTVAKRAMAVDNSAAASANMAAYYDSRSAVHKYNLLDAVAVNVSGTNPRQGNGPNNVPGVIVEVHQHEVGSNAQKKVVHQLYSVWCPAGVLTQKFKVDALTTLSINSFAELLAFRDQKLPAEARLAASDPNWRSPREEALKHYDTISLQAAWKELRSRFTQRPIDQSRQRKTATRVAADAADTAIAATRADEGLVCRWPQSLTRQPPSLPAERRPAESSKSSARLPLSTSYVGASHPPPQQ